MLTFNRQFLLLTLFLLMIEILIALFVRDRIIRPYFGDYLVVILVYCAFRTFIKLSTVKLAAGVLLLAYAIELLQHLRIVDKLGLSGNVVARTMIGYGFDWWDIVAYTLGIVTVLIVERLRS